MLALDAKTGKEIWKSKAAEWKDGYSMTVAPVVANGVLLTGVSGAEYGIRGFVDGWDPQNGNHLWRRYTIPARGEKGNGPGRRTITPGNMAVARRGSPARTIPISTSLIGARATPARGPAPSGREITSIPRP